MFVYDRIGKIIERVNLVEQSTDIILADYSSGLYYIKILSVEYQSSKAFIKL